MCGSLLAFKICGRASPALGREVECREGRRHLSSVLAASGQVDVCARCSVGFLFPRASSLLASHPPFWGLTSRLHCVRVHLPEIRAQRVTLGSRIALEISRFPLLLPENKGSHDSEAWQPTEQPGPGWNQQRKGRGPGILRENFSFLLRKTRDWTRNPLRLHLAPKMDNV